MGKKTGEGKENLPNKDAYKRINFLFQAATNNLAVQPQNNELTQHYMKCLRKVKEKKVLRWSREMKQRICNGCNMLLIPGVTSQTRIRANNRVVITCLTCNTKKRTDTKKPVMSKAQKRRKQRQRRNLKKKKESMKQTEEKSQVQ